MPSIDDYTPDLDLWGTPRSREGYDVAQICLNGHMINGSSVSSPEHNQDHCSTCGKPTITKCLECANPIRGYLWGSMTGETPVPSFCQKCGEPYPWTQSRIEAAYELAEELEDESDKKLLVGNIDDIVREGPKTTVAATRVRKIIGRLGPVVEKMLVNIASETAKRILFPDDPK